MTTELTARVDPDTARIIQNRLEAIAAAMGHPLVQRSPSSSIGKSGDFVAAICDERALQLCECKPGTPRQPGPAPGYVGGIMRTLMQRGDGPVPGDVIIHNDPYAGASRRADIGVCAPVFFHDELVGFAVTTAHHRDPGAGKSGGVESVDVCADALRFQAVKCYVAGERNEPVWQSIRDNTPVPDQTIGDLEAQVAASHIGAARYCELLGEFGRETIAAATEDRLDESERIMRARIAALPDGRYTATGYLDDDPDVADPALKKIPIVTTVTVVGDELTVDFTGSSPQLDDRPINMPFIGMVDAAVWPTLCSLLLDPVRYGNIPRNAGLCRPVRITAPRGSIANPIAPAPCSARFTPGNVVADTLRRALAPAVSRKATMAWSSMRPVA